MRRIRLIPLPLVLLVLAAACSVAGGPATDSNAPDPVRLTEDRPSSREEASAARLYVQAREAFDAGEWEAAKSLADDVVADYPGSSVAVDALWLSARARRRAGVDDAAALGATDRLLEVLPRDDRRYVAVTILRAEILVDRGEAGTRAGAVASVLAVVEPADASASLEAWLRDAIRELDGNGALRVAAAVEMDTPLAAVVLTEAGRRLREDGMRDAAVEVGAEAVRAGARGEDLEVARLLAEDLPLPGEVMETFLLAAILPQSGSPSMRSLATRIEAGIEAALEAAGVAERVELRILDDGGDPGAAAALAQAAERQGAFAVIGPLGTDALASAAAARRSVVLVSPTAFEVPVGAQGVYSLSAYDPSGAEAMAEWARGGALGPVAVVHAAFGPSADEATRFVEAYTASGGRVVSRVSYEPGLTYFEEQIDSALAASPETLLLPVPPEDLIALAPQVTFFGLDTLGVRIAGTSGWTDPAVLEEVSIRHLQGILAASPALPAEGSTGDVRFREAYESRFQRTLVDGSIEALGYDAASLVLEAVARGVQSADELDGALQTLPPFAGATGSLTVRAGRLRRSHSVVCMDGTNLLPSAAGDLPILQYRPYPPDPETDSVPEGPGRMAGYLCPQVAPPDTLR